MGDFVATHINIFFITVFTIAVISENFVLL